MSVLFPHNLNVISLKISVEACSTRRTGLVRMNPLCIQIPLAVYSSKIKARFIVINPRAQYCSGFRVDDFLVVVHRAKQIYTLCIDQRHIALVGCLVGWWDGGTVGRTHRAPNFSHKNIKMSGATFIHHHTTYITTSQSHCQLLVQYSSSITIKHD